MEYCQSEHFQPSCGADEVIFVHRARYGRLRLGRCVSQDFGFLGCEQDVLAKLDARCSGRRDCDVRVADDSFHISAPCHKDLKSYLEVDYECIKVVKASANRCGLGDTTIVTRQTGHLSSIVTSQTGCGSADSPWVVELEAGQRVSVSLLDFGYGEQHRAQGTGTKPQLIHDNHPGNQEPTCTVYATIRERDLKRSLTICGGREKEQHVYTSDTNSIELRFLNRPNPDDENTPQFIFHYEAIGCRNPRAPVFGWGKRDGYRATLGCRDSDLKWEITCVDGVWQGEVGNCTLNGDGQAYPEDQESDAAPLPHGVAFAVVVSIAFIIGVVVLVTGLLCIRWYVWRRSHPRRRRAREPKKQHLQHHQPNCPSFDRRVLKITMEGHIAHTTAEDAQPSVENEYAKMKCLSSSAEAEMLDDNTLNAVHEDYAIYAAAAGRHHPCIACEKCQQRETVYVSPGLEATHHVTPDIVQAESDKHSDYDSDTMQKYARATPKVYFYNNANQTLQRYNNVPET